ncbi:MAG: amidohydrolase family protein [Deltaproteobacteria bacterium]|nr:amidohydrolase family protein [Deltaproteobacteria bacterium]
MSEQRCDPPARPVQPPRLALPPGACDCHNHVFGPAALFPYGQPRSYTPPDAPVAEYVALHRTLGVSRSVIVQPSVYGRDHRATLDALRTYPAGRIRGVAVVGADTPLDELRALQAAGIRGTRINVLFRGGASIDDARRIAEHVAPLGWHLQLLVDVSQSQDALREMASFPVDVVIDHMGHMPAALGTGHAAFQALLRLLQGGRCWVKLSGPYRISAQGLPYRDVDPFVEALVRCNPERLVWGTDWPHPAIPGTVPDDGALVDLLATWLPDERLRRQVLVDNPARLYGFPRAP